MPFKNKKQQAAVMLALKGGNRRDDLASTLSRVGRRAFTRWQRNIPDDYTSHFKDLLKGVPPVHRSTAERFLHDLSFWHSEAFFMSADDVRRLAKQHAARKK